MVSATEVQSPSSTKGSAGRTIGRRIFLGLGILLLLVSLLTGYVRVVIISNSGFTDHAAAALNDPGVRSALSTAIVGRLVQNRPRLQLAEPVLQDVVATVIGSSAFEKVFRASLARTHRALLSEHNSKVVLNLSGQAAFILGVLSARAPRVANSETVQSARTRLTNISQRNGLLKLIQALNRVQAVAILAPIGAALCFALYLALAVDRRRALRNVGWSIAVPAFILWLLLAVGQWLSPSLVNDPLSQALPGIWQALLGDLRRWCIVLVLAGLIFVAIANASRQPPDIRVMGARIRSWFDPASPSPWRLVITGLVAVALGYLLVFNPLALFRLALILAGAAVTYWGVYAALSQTASASASPSSSGASEMSVGAGRWGAVAVVVVALGILLIRNVWTV